MESDLNRSFKSTDTDSETLVSKSLENVQERILPSSIVLPAANTSPDVT